MYLFLSIRLLRKSTVAFKVLNLVLSRVDLLNLHVVHVLSDSRSSSHTTTVVVYTVFGVRYEMVQTYRL